MLSWFGFGLNKPAPLIVFPYLYLYLYCAKSEKVTCLVWVLQGVLYHHQSRHTKHISKEKDGDAVQFRCHPHINMILLLTSRRFDSTRSCVVVWIPAVLLVFFRLRSPPLRRQGFSYKTSKVDVILLSSFYEAGSRVIRLPFLGIRSLMIFLTY